LNLDKNNFDYPTLGLLGESGELCEKFKKLIRDSNIDFKNKDKELQLSHKDVMDLLKEIGDGCWYLNRILWAKNISFEDLEISCDHEYFEYNNILDFVRDAVNLAYNISNIVCTDYENDENYYSNLKILGSAYLSLQHKICNLIDSSLEIALKINIEKLEDRKQRGVLKGSGDNR